MLEGNLVHPKGDGRFLSAPFDKTAFDNGFNYFYQQHAERGARPLSSRRIAEVLRQCLGESGKLQAGRADNVSKRVYFFPKRLGSLCDAFNHMVGTEIARDTAAHQETGLYEPDTAEIRNAVASWSRVDTSSSF